MPPIPPRPRTALDKRFDPFIARVWEQGRALYRDLPWRDTRDPYAILVSEVMLQQTQVSRVLKYWPRWMEDFPTVGALAAAPLEHVLEHWQGLGYNRRAIALQRAAQAVASAHGGVMPRDHDALLALPGVGPATAAGVRVFAFDEPDIYLETNVRSVFLHEFFPGQEGIADAQLIPLVKATCDHDDPRSWYYALLDFGAYLKQTMPNPSRASKHHSRQSAFEGSRRQKRARLLRLVMGAGEQGASETELLDAISAAELADGRPALTTALLASILGDLEAERFIVQQYGRWRIS